MKKLNLGCGYKIRSDCVNVDIAPLPGVDIVADLSKYPYPFENEAYDAIFCEDVLEHLSDFEGCMRQLHRILHKGGRPAP